MSSITTNSILIELSEDGSTPRIVVNGVDLADAITADWTLTSSHPPGMATPEAFLTVTFPVTVR
jgi:hypothetical protein